VTAAAWSVEAKKRAYRTDKTNSKEYELLFGAGLLLLAAEVSGISVLWVRDGATDYGTTSLFLV